MFKKLLLLPFVAILTACGSDLLYPTSPEDILVAAHLCQPAGGLKSVATKRDGSSDKNGYSTFRIHLVCENSVFIVAPSYKIKRQL